MNRVSRLEKNPREKPRFNRESSHPRKRELPAAWGAKPGMRGRKAARDNAPKERFK